MRASRGKYYRTSSMIVYIDGLSGLGKSTLVNTLKGRNPEWLSFKGAGAVNIGMGKDWQDYNFRMHQIIERLDQCNDYKKVILWDRGLTDSVYSTDDFYKSEITRVIRSHFKCCGVQLTTPTYDDYSKLLKRRPDDGFTYKESGEDVAKSRYFGYKKAFSGIRTHNVMVDMYVSLPQILEIEKYIGEELCG